MAIFTKKGRVFDVSGRALYGPVNTNNVFKGFGGQCEALNNGDAVVRYDQLAGRWLIVMPLFRDYTQTAIDPSDDCTIWYVGDYIRKGAATYSTRIGAFRLPGCS